MVLLRGHGRLSDTQSAQGSRSEPVTAASSASRALLTRGPASLTRAQWRALSPGEKLERLFGILLDRAAEILSWSPISELDPAPSQRSGDDRPRRPDVLTIGVKAGLLAAPCERDRLRCYRRILMLMGHHHPDRHRMSISPRHHLSYPREFALGKMKMRQNLLAVFGQNGEASHKSENLK